MAVSGYCSISKKVKKLHLEIHWNFRLTCCIKNPHWRSGGIIIFFCNYYIVISDTMVGSFLDVLILLLTVILSGLNEKPRRNKDWVTGRDITFLRDITFFIACPPCCVIFGFFLRLLPPSFRVAYLLNGPYKET